MVAGILKPLAVFSCQSQSQRYIKSIRNLGDAWRSLAEKPLLESDTNSVILETKFDLVLKIKNQVEEQHLSKPPIVHMSIGEYPCPSPTEQIAAKGNPRHYRVFADYGTDFIWRDPDDVMHEDGSTVLDPEEVLASYPPSVLELYDSWVDTYTENFRRRRDETGDYKATTFPTGSEEVAWNVAGFLLAWRIAMAPDVGRIKFTAGSSEYVLKKGEETSVTLNFLRDQVVILENGPVG